MSDIVEEVGEIRKILRIGASRKRSRAYFIHAALGSGAAPQRPASTGPEDVGPDCVVDISGASCAPGPAGLRTSDHRQPCGTTILAGNVDAPRAGRTKNPEGRRTVPIFWEGDPLAIKALSILGLDETAGLSEVKKRWRRLAKKLHPDKGGDTEVFIRTRTAYETLIGRSPSAER